MAAFTWTRMLAAGISSTLLGASVAAFMVYVAIAHDPQEEFCVHRASMDACAIRWGPVAELALAWFIPTFVLVLVVSAPALVAPTLRRR